MVSRKYNADFFDALVHESRNSANTISAIVWREIKPVSVLDVGCGCGVWLDAWRRQGVERIVGVDGDYVERGKLLVPESSFLPIDLNSPFDLGERFGLVQSLEVAEHLLPSSSEDFVDSLVRHGDLILFSAAVVGQGGEGHVNERPLEYWRNLFARRGLDCYDWMRPALSGSPSVLPWYRFNTFLYANRVGGARLPMSVRACRVPVEKPLAKFGDLQWRIRCTLLSILPRGVVTLAAQVRASFLARRYRRLAG